MSWIRLNYNGKNNICVSKMRNRLFFQYCDNNVELFSFAPSTVFVIDLLCNSYSSVSISLS